MSASSATPHNTCALNPSPALLSFGHTAGPHFSCIVFSCSERPQTEHSIQGTVSLVLSTEGNPLSYIGYTLFDTSQDAAGILGHLGTLLAHVQLAVN